MLLIFSWSVICSKMAYHVSLECMTGTLEKREPEFSSYISNVLFYFPLFSSFNLCTLPTNFLLGIFKALRIVASLHSRSSDNAFFTVNLLP